MSAIYPSLAGKRVVITGGGSGIGAAMVEAFARQGAQVFFLDIADADGRALQAKLGDAAQPPVFHRCDLTELDGVRATFSAIEASGGPIDVLVNNAANDDRHEIGAVTTDYWDQRIAVNLRHQFFCAQAVSGGMRAAGGGVILNLGSISWHLALPSLSIYMTAKAGIEGLTKGLARDLGGFNIRVNCIVPGAVRTPRQMKLWQSPESEAQVVAAQCLQQRIDPAHVAAMALFLASDDAARCSGREYYVDAGWHGA
ncbi:SDR family oxidoreductase [Variovorax sp. J31P179]|uniref:SDR family NAD(P)-dependent oxidoreductase n=1 Tax=Variovorax sp. J31P179 TaxID=3053508 RepID=UPI002575710E|nr:SDR family oxidoreductase [Variovorax sp. J31P179]MDM0079596.1 SDR family oxidoreductase [Variovorax sp. J31P179]